MNKLLISLAIVALVVVGYVATGFASTVGAKPSTTGESFAQSYTTVVQQQTKPLDK